MLFLNNILCNKFTPRIIVYRKVIVLLVAHVPFLLHGMESDIDLLATNRVAQGMHDILPHDMVALCLIDAAQKNDLSLAVRNIEILKRVCTLWLSFLQNPIIISQIIHKCSDTGGLSPEDFEKYKIRVCSILNKVRPERLDRKLEIVSFNEKGQALLDLHQWDYLLTEKNLSLLESFVFHQLFKNKKSLPDTFRFLEKLRRIKNHSGQFDIQTETDFNEHITNFLSDEHVNSYFPANPNFDINLRTMIGLFNQILSITPDALIDIWTRIAATARILYIREYTPADIKQTRIFDLHTIPTWALNLYDSIYSLALFKGRLESLKLLLQSSKEVSNGATERALWSL